MTKTIRIRVAPTIIHDVHQDWAKRELDAMRPGFLNQSEYDSLLVRVGTSENLTTIYSKGCMLIQD